MVNIENLWTAGGVLLGFQITAFSWRVSRELKYSDERRPVWLPIADWLNLAAMLIAAVGIFVLPVILEVGINTIKFSFGLSVLLFVGYAFSIAGHYEIFTLLGGPRVGRGLRGEGAKYFPRQERICVLLTVFAVLLYVIVALVN